MKMNPNPDGNKVWVKTELKKEMIKPNPEETMKKKKEFKPKTCDVFPAKKKLVKKMMLYYIVGKFSAFFHGGSSSVKANKTHLGN